MSGLLHLTDYLDPRGGGIASALLGLSSALEQPLQLWACDPPDPADSPPCATFFPTRRLGPVIWSSGMTRALDEHQPGVVHLHGLWGPASRAVAGSKSAIEHPLVVSPHGMLDPWALQNSRWKKQLAWRVWDGRVVRGASCLHALCLAEAESMRRLGLNQPIAVIPNGVTCPDTPPEREASTLFQALFLGRIHPKKGIDALIEGWARWHETATVPARLIVAGWDDGGHLDSLRNRARDLGCESSIHFPGPVFGGAKEKLLRESTLFLLPSLSEGLPMTILEAWAQALPVLMTEACHLPEGFDTGAALHIEPSAESIARALNQFTSLPPDRRTEIGLAGHALVKERFRWSTVAARFREVYAWLDGGPRPSCLVEAAEIPGP